MLAKFGGAPTALTGNVDDVLASIVSGSSTAVDVLGTFALDEIQRRASHHGLVPLLAERLHDVPGIAPQLACWLKAEARKEVALDLLREREICAVLAALHHRNVAALLLKGVQVAYQWYPRADLRPRMDTDILVQPDDRREVDDVLRDLGYESACQVSGDLLMYQAAYLKRRGDSLVHVLDVHWRIANPQAFRGVLVHGELLRHAVPVPRLGAGAYALSPVDALLLACVHRVAHHFDADRLIWLYDIHLIASALTDADWERFLHLASQRNVAAVCRRSLERTVGCFETPLPRTVLLDARLASSGGAEATAGYIGPRAHVCNVVQDLLALRAWGDRVRLMRQHLFPSARYMRNVYARSSRAPLAVLYARRAVRGARRWLDPSPSADQP